MPAFPELRFPDRVLRRCFLSPLGRMWREAPGEGALEFFMKTMACIIRPGEERAPGEGRKDKPSVIFNNVLIQLQLVKPKARHLRRFAGQIQHAGRAGRAIACVQHEIDMAQQALFNFLRIVAIE